MIIKPKILMIIVIFLILAKGVYGYGEGSGGMTTSNIDPYSNIVKYEVREGNLIYNRSVEYSFTTPEFGIFKVLVNGNETEYNIPVRIETLRNTSKYAKPAPGIVYRNENVWIGTKRLNYVGIRFKVKNSWIVENNLNDTIHPYLLKWNGTVWLVLKTNITGNDSINTYFEAPRVGSSNIGIFAISAPPKIVNNMKVDWAPNSSEIEENVDPIIESIQIKNSSAFDIIISMLILLIVYVCRKGRGS